MKKNRKEIEKEGRKISSTWWEGCLEREKVEGDWAESLRIGAKITFAG